MYPTLLQANKTPLSHKQSSLMLMLLTMSKNPSQNFDDYNTPLPMEEKVPPIVRIIEGRLEYANVLASPCLLLLLEGLSEGNPGRAVLWAYTIAVWCHTNDKVGMTMSDFIDCYPEGVPSPEDYSTAWEGQKTREGNALDIGETWAKLRRATC
jgi:hypothetical protein